MVFLELNIVILVFEIFNFILFILKRIRYYNLLQVTSNLEFGIQKTCDTCL